MQILHVTSGMHNNGTGITNLLIDLSCEQAKQHDVTVLCTEIDDRLEALLRKHGVDVRTFEWGGKRNTRRNIRQLRFQLNEHVKCGCVIHIHTVRALLLVAIARPRALQQTVTTAHNEHNVHSMLMPLLSSRCVAVSESNRARLSRRTFGRADRRLVTIRNGTLGGVRDRGRIVDAHETDATAARDMREDRSAVLYAGGLNSRKGIDLLLGRLAGLTKVVPTAHLYVISSRDNPSIDELVERLGVTEHVSFLGFRENPLPYMMRATVLAVPSRREPFGLVALEARAANLPVVASNVDGLPEVLDGGRAGVLVDTYDDGAWITALSRVLSDASYRAGLVERGLTGLDAFTVQTMASGYDVVYASVMVRRSDGPHP